MDWRSYKSAQQSFLPTEAQWEYAARGAEPVQYPWGNEPATSKLLNVCWDTSTYDSKGNVAAHVATPLEELPLVPVNAQIGMSPFGLRGMAGNVWQWCRDTYHSNFYLASEAGPSSEADLLMKPPCCSPSLKKSTMGCCKAGSGLS